HLTDRRQGIAVLLPYIGRPPSQEPTVAKAPYEERLHHLALQARERVRVKFGIGHEIERLTMESLKDRKGAGLHIKLTNGRAVDCHQTPLFRRQTLVALWIVRAVEPPAQVPFKM